MSDEGSRTRRDRWVADPSRTIGRGRARVARGLGHLGTLAVQAVQRFLRHRGTQLAAAISYYALLSSVPAAIVLAAVLGLAFGSADARTEVIDSVFDALPLSEGQGRSDLESTIKGVTGNAAALGIAGLGGLVFTASALMGSVRAAVNTVFDEPARRPPVRGKLLDILLVLGLGVLVTLSLAATIVSDFAIDIQKALGVPGELLEAVLDATGILFPLLLSVIVYATVYVVTPAHRVRLRDVWPGVVFAAPAYELAKRGFTLYLENFANYNAVYGSLGAVISFLAFIYVAAIVLLIGAEIAAVWPRVRAGQYQSSEGPRQPLGTKVIRVLRGLVLRERGRPEDDRHTE